jgi:outer membrane protein assembly factor BamA
MKNKIFECKFIVCFLWVLLGIPNVVFSQEKTFSSDSLISDSSKVFKALPVIYYTPETGFALEAFAYYSFKLKNAERASNARLFATYTQMKQYMFILPVQLYTNNEGFFINSYNDFRYFPEFFYGLGNETTEKERTLYEFKAFQTQNKILRKMKSNSYAGIHMQYQHFDVHFDTEDSLWTQDVKMLGTDYFKHVIVGGVYMYDSRDHILAPRKGMFLETMINYGLGEADGSRTRFWQMMVDVRKYFSPNERNVIATHGLFQTCSGDVPFRILPSLGGPLIHRGYYMGRFRDKHATLLQAEWRYSFPKKWGFTVFSSVGKVSNTFKELNLNGLHPALGTGLRYRMSQRDQTTIRLDYSKTPDSQGIYLYFAEAF